MKETEPSVQLLAELSETPAAQWARGKTERVSPDHLAESRRGLVPTGYGTHCEMSGRVFQDCRRHTTGDLEEEPKARKGRYESGLG